MDFAAKTPFRKSNTPFFAAKKTAQGAGKTNTALDEAIMAARAGAEVPSNPTNTSNPSSTGSDANSSAESSQLSSFSPSPQSSGSDLESIFSTTHPPSAQEIINARYGKSAPSASAGASPSIAVASARDAINAAKRQAKKPASDTKSSQPTPLAPSTETAKSASKLHHGFIQRSMESTRASASALLRNSKGEKPDTPAVRTSLKLGADALPAKPVATLPPNARMARAAQPIDAQGNVVIPKTRRTKKILSPAARRAKLPAQRSVKAIPVNGVSPAKKSQSKQRSIAISDGNHQIAVTDASAQPQSTKAQVPSRSSQPAQAPTRSAKSVTPPARAAQRAARQLIGGRPLAVPAPAPAAAGVAVTRTGQKTVTAQKVAPAQKTFTTQKTLAVQQALSADHPAGSPRPQAPRNSHRSNTQPTPRDLDGLGVVEDYAAPGAPHFTDPSETSAPGINARDPKNPKAHKAEDNRRTLGKQSPFFLKSVNVEKRPLSHETAGIATTPGVRRVTNYSANTSPVPSIPAEKSTKSKFGNIRSHGRKKDTNQGPNDDFLAPVQQNLPERPTVIIPSSRRSSAPLFFLVLLTVILGAAVGAAAYLCFFQ